VVEGGRLYTMEKESLSVTIIDDMFVIGYGPFVTGYLKARKDRTKSNNMVRQALSEMKNREFCLSLSLTGSLKKKMDEALSSGKMGAFDSNVFIQSLRNLRRVSLSMGIGDTVSVDVTMSGDSQLSGERLVMFSHFLIVGTSLVIPFASQVSMSLAKQDLPLRQDGLDAMQALIGRVRTTPTGSGVRLSFELTKEEVDFFVSSVKESMAKSKEEKLRQEKDSRLAGLNEAIEKKDLKAVKELLRDMGSANPGTGNGKNPLTVAAAGGQLDMAGLLLENNASLGAFSDDGGTTPLHGAVVSGNPDMVSLLLSKKADIALRDSFGKTPLYLAVDREDLKILRILISAGSDVNSAALDGESPLHVAAAKGSMDMVNELLKAGAEAAVKNFYDETPADKARGAGHGALADMLAREAEKAEKHGKED
jgi:ankyrin repeat protein